MLKKKALKSVKWSFIQQICNQVIGLFITLTLARILEPSAFGLLGMIYVVISIGTVLIDSGLGISLIRSKSISDADLSTIFFSNLILSSGLYLIIFFLAPYIAWFYKQEILVKLVRILSISLIINSLYLIQNVILTRELIFKKIAFITIFSTLLSGIIGISLARLNYGVWSIVVMNISNSICSLILYWNISKWRPKWIFQKAKLREHFGFGFRLTLVTLMDSFFSNVYNIVIGKFYNVNLLGYYTRADGLKNNILFGISSPLKTVLLPLLREFQEDREKLKNIYSDIIQIVVLVVAPVLLYFFLFAKPIFYVLFTDKWDSAVPFFRILCLAGIIYPVNTYVVSFLLVRGRSDLVLWLNLVKKITLIVTIIFTIGYSNIYYLIWGQVVASFFDFVYNLVVLKWNLNLDIITQFRTIFLNLLIAGSAGIIVYLINISLGLNELRYLYQLVIGLISYVVLVFGFVFMFNKRIFGVIWSFLS